ncbi:MAG: CHAT domain-containing protein, partial [Kofleriaceae bacterium]
LAPEQRWRALTPETVLHVVADSSLASVPFAALVRDGRRWIEQTAIAFAPNVAVLARLRHAASSDGTRVVLGDPTNDLQGAREEAAASARTLGVSAHLGRAASIAALRSAAHADVLTVAAHSEVTEAVVKLRLADGDVTPAEIIDQRIAPRLVVLASCSSAVTDVDAWGAFAGAFLAAGTRDVIASRWALHDRIATEFVATFLRDGGVASPALALASAQRRAIKQGIPVSTWAALGAFGVGTEGTQTTKERLASNE